MIINSFGNLYRISRKDWARWLQAHADEKDPMLADFGGKLIGTIDHTITDMYPSEAAGLLEDIKNKSKNKKKKG